MSALLRLKGIRFLTLELGVFPYVDSTYDRCRDALIQVKATRALSSNNHWLHDNKKAGHCRSGSSIEQVRSRNMSTTAQGLVTLVNPIGERQGEQSALAPRLDTLQGKSIGFIDNIKPNAGLFLRYIEEMIRADYPGVQTHTVRKDFTPNHLIADRLYGKVHGVVNAWGD